MTLSTVFLYMLIFCRVMIGLVFLWTSVGKLRDVAQFQQTIARFRILPTRLSGLAALLFLGAEFTVVLLVSFGGPFLSPGFALADVLLLMFCLALVSVLVRGIRISCNCFGSTSQEVSYFDVWRNIGLILCASTGYGILSITTHLPDPGLADWIFIGLAVGAVFLIWMQFRSLIQLFQRS